MNELIEIFDKLLSLMVSYPITLFHILAFPSKIISATGNDSLVSPPGASLVISFYIYHLSHVTEIRARFNPEKKLSLLPEKDFVIKVFLLIITLLLAQYLFLLIPSVLPHPPENPVLTIRILSYPISLVMAIYGLIYMIYFLFPIGTKIDDMTIEEKVSMTFREVRKESGSKRIVATENAKFFAMGMSILIYGVGTFNILRAFFNLNGKDAICPFISVVVAAIISALLVIWVFLRYDKFITKLQTQKKVIPENPESEIDPQE